MDAPVMHLAGRFGTTVRLNIKRIGAASLRVCGVVSDIVATMSVIQFIGTFAVLGVFGTGVVMKQQQVGFFKDEDSLWREVTAGTQTRVEGDDDAFIVSIDGDAVSDGSDELLDGGDDTTLIGAGLRSRCKLSGNFDIEIAYELIGWPPHNGVRVGLEISTERNFWHGVLRVRYGKGEYQDLQAGGNSDYMFSFIGRERSDPQPIGGDAGSLRLLRLGEDVFGFYKEGTGSWIPLGTSGQVSNGDMTVGLYAWTHDGDDPQFGGEVVAVMLKDFVMTRGEWVCSD